MHETLGGNEAGTLEEATENLVPPGHFGFDLLRDLAVLFLRSEAQSLTKHSKERSVSRAERNRTVNVQR